MDAIVNNPDAPDFPNTIEALEFAGRTLNRVSGIFYNILEADTNDELQRIAEEVSPLMTEYEMYVSLNDKLFERVKSVYAGKDSLGLEPDQRRLLENTYRSFARNGANLSEEDKAVYSKYVEELSLLSLQFGKNVLASTNAYKLHLTDSSDLAGLPDYVRELGAMTAGERGLEGWVFTLDYPSYLPFMQNSERPDLRREMFLAYNSKALGGENDNTETVRKIADLRIKIANILGYETWADYVLEENMAKDKATVVKFLDDLMTPSLPYARKDVEAVFDYAKANGFAEMARAAGMDPDQFMPWDFSYWSEKYKQAEYALSDEQLKPYFRLEDCIDAVFSLAGRLYGISFEERKDIPVYHKDVKVYDVKDADGSHLALFYADFFPRASKRGGAWMTEFRGQSIRNGVEIFDELDENYRYTTPVLTENAVLSVVYVSVPSGVDQSLANRIKVSASNGTVRVHGAAPDSEVLVLMRTTRSRLGLSILLFSANTLRQPPLISLPITTPPCPFFISQLRMMMFSLGLPHRRPSLLRPLLMAIQSSPVLK